MGLLIILATATFLQTKIKAALKLCYVKAEMHLDDFILQKLPRDEHISFPSRRLCRVNALKGEKKKSLFFKRAQQFSSGLLGDELCVLKIKELTGHLH